MRLFLYGLAGSLIVMGLLYHFAALAVFNALVPKDEGSFRLASGIAYGPSPRQSLDLYRPKGDGDFPVLLFLYGGSWDSGHKEDYAFVGRAFAARGYLTAIADYRLVPRAHYPDFVDDAALAINWLSEQAANHGGDPHRLFAAGHSAGAYNIVQAVLRNGLQDKVNAIAVLAAPLDFQLDHSPKIAAAFAAAGDFFSTQPVNQVLSTTPPILLLHGAGDTTVGPHNSRNMHARLVAARRQTELKLYDDMGHVGIMLALAKPFRGNAPVLNDVVTFFQRYD